MWARKRLDIGLTDLAGGFLNCLLPRNREAAEEKLLNQWPADHDSLLICTSVRSGFDLLLQALQLPPGSEILISAVTIPDMLRIIEQHGLVPVPIDIDAQNAAPRVDRLHPAHTPRTRALLVAHLFGSRFAMEPFVEFARRHDLLLIEDCAQAYCGPTFSGHPDSDVCLFSFGPIKAATALAGGLIRVRDRNLAERMRTFQAEYPRQTRRSYFARLGKYTLLKLIALRGVFGAVLSICKVCGIDHDRLLNAAVRSYAAEEFFEKLRQRPGTPLLLMLARRLRNYDAAVETEKIRRGRELAQRLEPWIHCPAGAVSPHAFWVFPILAADPQALILHLLQHGFDATQGQSMVAVQPPAGRNDLSATHAEKLLAGIVYLPFYNAMPESELNRMAEVIERAVQASREVDS